MGSGREGAVADGSRGAGSAAPLRLAAQTCWVQIRDAPIDLRLLGKRRRGGTKGRRLDETSPRACRLTDGRTPHTGAA
jgi:hypothetical protein